MPKCARKGQFMQVEIATNPHVVAPINATFIANYSKSRVWARRFHGNRIAKLSGLLFGNDSTGGGIFLTPLLLLIRWARTKTAAAVSALFILVNSASGLRGNLASTRRLPPLALTSADKVQNWLVLVTKTRQFL